jgi:hypothetical protein
MHFDSYNKNGCYRRRKNKIFYYYNPYLYSYIYEFIEVFCFVLIFCVVGYDMKGKWRERKERERKRVIV